MITVPFALIVFLTGLLVLLVILVSWAHWSFDRAARLEAAALLAAAPRSAADVITRDLLNGLPPPVRQWLERSGVVGRPRITSARLKQRGETRAKPGGK